MNEEPLTVEWVAYDSIGEERPPDLDLGCLGGFFQDGMRWADYIGRDADPAWSRRMEAIRAAIIERGEQWSGDYHQNGEDGVPLLSDGSFGCYSMRAWGDLMAAVWSTELDQDFSYLDFYMDGWGRVLADDQPQSRGTA